VSHKSRRIAELIEPFRGRAQDARYLAYFECFNRQLFFEAHDVLEEMWLAQRGGCNDAFHKGLIQLAGAWVHLQKGRLRPAAAVFRLARANLSRYTPTHEGLDVEGVLRRIGNWLRGLEGSRFEVNPLGAEPAPRLELGGG